MTLHNATQHFASPCKTLFLFSILCLGNMLQCCNILMSQCYICARLQCCNVLSWICYGNVIYSRKYTLIWLTNLESHELIQTWLRSYKDNSKDSNNYFEIFWLAMEFHAKKKINVWIWSDLFDTHALKFIFLHKLLA